MVILNVPNNNPNLELYLIPNDEITPYQRRVLEEAHGKYIGGKDDSHYVDVLANFLTEDKGCFHRYKVYDDNAEGDKREVVGTITNVYVAGWLTH